MIAKDSLYRNVILVAVLGFLVYSKCALYPFRPFTSVQGYNLCSMIHENRMIAKTGHALRLEIKVARGLSTSRPSRHPARDTKPP